MSWLLIFHNSFFPVFQMFVRTARISTLQLLHQYAKSFSGGCTTCLSVFFFHVVHIFHHLWKSKTQETTTAHYHVAAFHLRWSQQRSLFEISRNIKRPSQCRVSRVSTLVAPYVKRFDIYLWNCIYLFICLFLEMRIYINQISNCSHFLLLFVVIVSSVKITFENQQGY